MQCMDIVIACIKPAMPMRQMVEQGLYPDRSFSSIFSTAASARNPEEAMT